MEETSNPKTPESDRGDSIPIPVIRENSIPIPVIKEDTIPATKEDGTPIPVIQKTGDPNNSASEESKPLISNIPQNNDAGQGLNNSEIEVAEISANTAKVESQPEPTPETQKAETDTKEHTQVKEDTKSQQKEIENNEPEKGVDQVESKKVDSASCSQVEQPKERVGSAVGKNQSDVFSSRDEEAYFTSSLFSVNGARSRRVYRKREAAPNNIFPEKNTSLPPNETPKNTMRDKDSYHSGNRPSSSVRNPLTGEGLISNDEFRFRGNRRKDGNPLLGVGYSDTNCSSQRTPPGGFSHKLW